MKRKALSNNESVHLQKNDVEDELRRWSTFTAVMTGLIALFWFVFQ